MATTVHPTAIVDAGAQLGDGTKVWHHCHVRGTAKLGRDCNIGKGVYIDSEVTLGDGCKVQNGANLYRGLTVGNQVFIGPDAQFTNDLVPRATEWNDAKLVRTKVEDGVSVGSNATIICGITLGTYAMVAAGSVVTKDVPPYGLVMGNPARLRGFVDQAGNKIAKAKTEGNHAVLQVAPGVTHKIPLDLWKKVHP